MYNSIEIKNTFKVPLMSIGIVLIFALGVMIWLSSTKEFIYVVEADEIQAGKTITVDMIKAYQSTSYQNQKYTNMHEKIPKY